MAEMADPESPIREKHILERADDRGPLPNKGAPRPYNSLTVSFPRRRSLIRSTCRAVALAVCCVLATLAHDSLKLAPEGFHTGELVANLRWRGQD
jgi:hypothetical protein